MLGCQLYVKEITSRPTIAERDVTLEEGDVVLRINHLPADNMTLKEANKILDVARERLSLTVRREPNIAGLDGKGMCGFVGQRMCGFVGQRVASGREGQSAAVVGEWNRCSVCLGWW